jgi:hypothetical protein
MAVRVVAAARVEVGWQEMDLCSGVGFAVVHNMRVVVVVEGQRMVVEGGIGDMVAGVDFGSLVVEEEAQIRSVSCFDVLAQVGCMHLGIVGSQAEMDLD